MKSILWIGDAVVASGFSKVTHNYLSSFIGDWDINILGLNYNGDPHKYPYGIYPCWPGGDAWGIGRIKILLDKHKPDMVVVQNDPWNVPAYIEVIKKTGDYPIVAVMPVDGFNVKDGTRLNDLSAAIFWTKFGLDEARVGGYEGPAEVIPLGVDLDVFRPVVQESARMDKIRLPEELRHAFIVGNINRNQPRKRLDLTVRYFAEWIKASGIEDAFLYLHLCPTGDQGYDIDQLMHYYGVSNRLLFANPDIGYGVTEERLVNTYGCFDIQVSTTQGEGWGLTTMEGMACGIPQIAPKWSALEEWARDYSYMVNCPTTSVTPNNVNILGGIPDEQMFINAMNSLYESSRIRNHYHLKGLECAGKDKYRWPNISIRFRNVIEDVLELRKTECQEQQLKVAQFQLK